MCIQLKQLQNIHIQRIFLHLSIDIELVINLLQTIQIDLLSTDQNPCSCFSNQLHSILLMVMGTACNRHKPITYFMFNKNRLIDDLSRLG